MSGRPDRQGAADVIALLDEIEALDSEIAGHERTETPVHHTDDLIHLGWSEASAAAALWFNEPGPWIVEGVAVPRALRKWLAAHPEGKPCDVVYWLEEPHEPVTPGQASMAKGCATVWDEIEMELRRRGVQVLFGKFHG